MIDFGSNEEFIENYKRLKSSRKMGELYHCTKNVITKHAREIGYDYSNNKEIKITNIPPEEVYALYCQLGAAQKVGDYYGCSGTAVLRFLKNNNYNINESPTKSKVDFNKDEFIENYNKLKSSQAMSELYNCSTTTILKYAKKFGYDYNKNKNYKLTNEDKQYIIDHYYTDSSTDLAKKFQVSRGMITKVWFDNGLSGKEVTNIKTTKVDLTGQKFGMWTVLEETNERTAGGGIKWKCQCDCGEIKNVSSLSLTQGVSLSCGKHHISKGNNKITEILTEANIPFETEKIFDGCKYKNHLRFDFYVNNEYLIEYDGMQHFNPQDFFVHENFEERQEKDRIKNQWSKDNNIPLIRIPYTHYNKLCLDDLLLETSTFII